MHLCRAARATVLGHLSLAALVLVTGALVRRAGAQSADTVRTAGAPRTADTASAADTARGVDTLRRMYRLPVPAPTPVARTPYKVAPGLSISTPTAFGASWGDVYAGLGFQERARYISGSDGFVSAGFGIGDENALVGVQVDVISFSTLRSGWGKRFALDVMVHRALPGMIGVALGVESAVSRKVDHPPSRFVTVSKLFQLRRDWSASFSSLAVSVGVGDGRFRTESDWIAGVKTANVFGSAALQVAEPVSVIADWTGQDLAVGLSVVPVRKLPLVVSPGFIDVTGRAGDGARFIMGVGIGFNWLSSH